MQPMSSASIRHCTLKAEAAYNAGIHALGRVSSLVSSPGYVSKCRAWRGGAGKSVRQEDQHIPYTERRARGIRYSAYLLSTECKA